MPVKLTAVIITLNEERNIRRCIESLYGVADEIIVVDSGSTDNTIAISKQMQVVIHSTQWNGYAATKNLGNTLSTNDWILSIDADEALDDTLRNAILNWKTKDPSTAVGELNRLTNYCGSWIYHSGWYPDRKIRIFDRTKVHWEGAFVHEELTVPSFFEILPLEGHLLHYSYYDATDHLERANRYSLLTAQKLAVMGKKATIFKPFISAFGRFIAMYILKKGFLDGKMGFQIAWISAKSNIVKYKELRRLTKND